MGVRYIKHLHTVNAQLISSCGVSSSTVSSATNEWMFPPLEHKEGSNKLMCVNCPLLLRGLQWNLMVATTNTDDQGRGAACLCSPGLLAEGPAPPPSLLGHSFLNFLQFRTGPWAYFQNGTCFSPSPLVFFPLIISRSLAVVPRSWRLFPGPKVSLQSPGRYGNQSIVMLSPEWLGRAWSMSLHFKLISPHMFPWRSITRDHRDGALTLTTEGREGSLRNNLHSELACKNSQMPPDFSWITDLLQSQEGLQR